MDCAEVWLKLEHLQVGGSFKARGMLYRLLANPVPESGVIIASGGNAGIAVAAAAKALGVRCEVFVPEVSPEAKRARLRALGAEVVVTGAAYSQAFEACVARQKATGALQAHAYDQPEVVAGAGTLALEMEEQGGRLPDTVLVSVGGGGLIGGVAAWVESRAHVVALEPELAPTLHAARAAGQPVDVDVGGVAADSLGARRIGVAVGSAKAGVQIANHRGRGRAGGRPPPPRPGRAPPVSAARRCESRLPEAASRAGSAARDTVHHQPRGADKTVTRRHTNGAERGKENGGNTLFKAHHIHTQHIALRQCCEQ
mgnify:CR=1 FL=1